MECDQSETTETGDKRKTIQKLIERYYHQLTQGCGSNSCSNQNCASSGLMLSPNDAAARSLQCLTAKAKLCEIKTMTIEDEVEEMEVVTSDGPSCSQAASSSSSCVRYVKTVMFLDEEKLDDLISECQQSGNFSTLKQTLWDVFSSPESLGQSWLVTPASSSTSSSHSSSSACDNLQNMKKMTKEEVRALEGEKDVDSCEISEEKTETKEKTKQNASSVCTVNIDALRRSYEKLFNLDNSIFESGLVNALMMLCSNLEMDLKVKPNVAEDVNFLNLYEIVLELPVIGYEAYLENVLPIVCRGISLLPVDSQASLVRYFSSQTITSLKSMLENLQQILSLRVYTGTFTRDHLMNDDETVSSVVSVIRILYYASLLGGAGGTDTHTEWDTSELPIMDADNFSSIEISGNASRKRYHDPLSEALKLSPLDVRVPVIPIEEFYNEPLNETIEMDKDFTYWKMNDPFSSSSSDKPKFSFMSHPFILNPATKSQALYYDNRIMMYRERRMTLLQVMAGGLDINPYLKLQIRRDHIIADALVELEMVVLENPADLKKQLVVEFDSEQGIDEGGLSKEFFQLIIEEIFNPDYGMFIHCSESHTYWFNPSSYESCAQFTLIGIVLGLAMYNSVILDLHLPSVIYRKLGGKKGNFEDLKEFKPSIWKGLNELLEYAADDMEDVFMQPFQVSYTDLFGSTITVDLKEGGANIMVNQSNKREYAELYADFLINKNVEQQFLAFQRGFDLVTSESPVHMLFTPRELEMLICGEKEFDFNELENSTEYDGGYNKETNVVRWFWDAVHNMDLEDKRRLLQFTTGSDRIPVGGLAKLRLTIAKNGSDSERLPTAHTCFNVLLLPEYSTREKLNDLLMKAIKECKGFGML